MKLIQLLKSKIHHARVSYANADYVGSIEICSDVMERVGLVPGEFVYIWNVENAERFTTYCFPGPQGVFGVNGAAAHRVKPGDRLIVAAFTWTDEKIEPKLVLMNEQNKVERDMEPYTTHG